MRRSLLVTGFLTALLLVCPTGVLARGARPELPAQAQVRAVLYGQPIPPTDVVNHHCHDLDAPTYRCFDTEVERDADAQTFVAGTLSFDALTQPLSSLNFTFALVYTDADYEGSSMLVATPMPDLGLVGWNNVISSFKSTNGGHPKWWANTSYGGSYWQWAVSAWVPYVGDLADNKFSSVKNVP